MEISKSKQIRNVVFNAIPQIGVASVKGIFSLNFTPHSETPLEYKIESPLVGTQIIYSKSIQFYSFLIVEPAQILKLAARAFPGMDRIESPKMVTDANSEVLNSFMAKLSSVIKVFDSDSKMAIGVPIYVNFSGENRITLNREDSKILNLTFEDINLFLITSIQFL